MCCPLIVPLNRKPNIACKAISSMCVSLICTTVKLFTCVVRYILQEKKSVLWIAYEVHGHIFLDLLNIFTYSLRTSCIIFWSYVFSLPTPLRSSHTPYASKLIFFLSLKTIKQAIKQTTWIQSNMYWLTTPEHGVCLGAWLIYLMSLHWKKTIFWFSLSQFPAPINCQQLLG